MTHIAPYAHVVVACCAPADFLEPGVVSGLLLSAVAAGAIGLAIGTRNGARNSRLLACLALSCSIVGILSLTLVPTQGPRLEHQLMPLVHIGAGASDSGTDIALNIAGNALLFVPFGAALGLFGFRIRTTIFVSCAVAALIEVTQLLVPGRTTSVDDLLLNVLGAGVGHLVLRTLWAGGCAEPSRNMRH